jgi:tetratricopeptide (TPR) repeat protein
MSMLDEEVRTCNVQGIALAQQGRLDEAAAWFRHALTLDPNSSAAHNNLGNILSMQGSFAEAVTCYRAALGVVPNDARTWNNLSNSLRQLNELDEAIDTARRALALEPNFADAHTNLGIALEAKGEPELEKALFHCESAVQLRPELPEAQNNLGLVYRRVNRLEDAIARCREALRLRPDFAEAYNNLGTALLRQENWDEAADCFQHALRLRPDLVMGHVNLATYFWRQDRLDEGIAHCTEALRLKPDLAAARNIIGAILLKRGKFAEARSHFDEAIRLDPEFAEARSNRAMVLLPLGELEEGWRDYEWRWKRTDFMIRPFETPIWDGAPVAGKTVLLHAEQGLGDTLQFIRYAALVKKLGARVLFACPKALLPLVSRCAGIDQLRSQEDPAPAYDAHAPLMSLPGILKTTMATIPADVPYLFADEKLIELWRRELAGFAGFKAGIAWKGNSKHAMDRQRSMPLAQFAPLALDGVHLLSLQKGEGTEQLAGIAGRFTVTDLSPRLDVHTGAFMDTAAVMKNLDLVITTDTAIAHLAGGLGVPVWVALPFVPDWRWLLDRADSPWYPTMRLFRQTVPGKWEDVFARMSAELETLVCARPQALSILIEVAPGELIDKITILEIKRARITDTTKVANVQTELDLLSAARDRALRKSPELDALTEELKKTNIVLWDVEDEIRLCERDQDFGPRFIELARSVYRHNDRRSAVKRQINELLGSKLIEEKSYEQYS